MIKAEARFGLIDITAPNRPLTREEAADALNRIANAIHQSGDLSAPHAVWLIEKVAKAVYEYKIAEKGGYVEVDIYDDFGTKRGAIFLPDERVSTKYIKDNWADIISGPLLELMLETRVYDGEYDDLEGVATEKDYVAWLKNHSNWKRGFKGKISVLDLSDYWGVPNPVDGCIHRMFMTDEFQDGLDLNFMSAPKDERLLSIHVHSD